MRYSTGNSCRSRLIGIAFLIVFFSAIAIYGFITESIKNSPSGQATSTAEQATSYAQADQAATNTEVAQEQLLSQNVDIPNLNNPGSSSSPYIKGKVVIIDKTEKRLDTALLDASDPLLATNPANVGTVIWLNCNTDELNYSYNNINPATWWHCDMTIIDKAKATIVGSKHFDGEYPPQTIDCYSPSPTCSCCSRPDADMTKYIQSLPQK